MARGCKTGFEKVRGRGRGGRESSVDVVRFNPNPSEWLRTTKRYDVRSHKSRFVVDKKRGVANWRRKR